MNFYGPKRQSLENPVRRTTRLVDEIQYGTQKDLPLQSLARSQPSKCYALVRFLRFASMTRRRTYRSQLSIRQKCLDLKVCRPWVPKKVTTDHRKVYRKYNLTVDIYLRVGSPMLSLQTNKTVHRKSYEPQNRPKSF